ncbi:MAG TPA: hypothetical protein VFQ83_11900, partial [Candidatus Udaeobacter sp.]|nr:hypothetical protein [Candidatus Udaeobacter sp.]
MSQLGCVSRLDTAYFGAVSEASLTESRFELSPIVIASPLNGGAGFAGNSGRKTANVCDAKAIKTNMNIAAHFMTAALSKIGPHRKQNF